MLNFYKNGKKSNDDDLVFLDNLNENCVDSSSSSFSRKEFFINSLFRELEFNYLNKININSCAYNYSSNNVISIDNKKLVLSKANKFSNRLRLEKEFFNDYGGDHNRLDNIDNFIKYRKKSKVKLKKYYNHSIYDYKSRFNEMNYGSYSCNKLSIVSFFKKSLTLKGIFDLKNKFMGCNDISKIYPLINYINNNLDSIFSCFIKGKKFSDDGNLVVNSGPVTIGDVLLNRVNEFKFKESINRCYYGYGGNIKDDNREEDDVKLNYFFDNYSNLLSSDDLFFKKNLNFNNYNHIVYSNSFVKEFNLWYRELCWYRFNNNILKKSNWFDFFDLDYSRSMFLEKRFFNLNSNLLNYSVNFNFDIFYINWLVFFFYNFSNYNNNNVFFPISFVTSNNFGYYYLNFKNFGVNLLGLKSSMELFYDYLINFNENSFFYCDSKDDDMNVINMYLLKNIGNNLLILDELSSNEVYLNKVRYIISFLNDYYILKKLFLKFLKGKDELHIDVFFKKLNRIFNFLKFKDEFFREHYENIVKNNKNYGECNKNFSTEDLVYLRELIVQDDDIFFDFSSREEVNSNVEWYFDVNNDENNLRNNDFNFSRFNIINIKLSDLYLSKNNEEVR